MPQRDLPCKWFLWFWPCHLASIYLHFPSADGANWIQGMREVHEIVNSSNIISQELSISERNVFQCSFVVLTSGKQSLNKLLFDFAQGIWYFFVESPVNSHCKDDTPFCFLTAEQEQQNWDVPGKLHCVAKYIDFQAGSFQPLRNRQLRILNIYPYPLLSLSLCLPRSFWFKPITCFLGLWTCCKCVMQIRL